MTRASCDIVDVYPFRRAAHATRLSRPSGTRARGTSTNFATPRGAAAARRRARDPRAPAEVHFLMLHRSPDRYLGGTWQAVHGRIEPGETAWQAALRELREETNLLPLAFYQVDTVNTFYMKLDDTVHHCPCFAAEIVSDAKLALNDEHDAYEWVPADEALDRFIWPGQRRAVREILAEIIRPGPAIDYLRIDIAHNESAESEK